MSNRRNRRHKRREFSDTQEELFFDTWNALDRKEQGRKIDWECAKHTDYDAYLCHVLKDRVLSQWGVRSCVGVDPLEFIEWHPDRQYRLVVIEADPQVLNPYDDRLCRGLSKRLRAAASAKKLKLVPAPHIVTSPLGAHRVKDMFLSFVYGREENVDRYALLCIGIDVWEIDENPPSSILRQCIDDHDPDRYPDHLPPRPWK